MKRRNLILSFKFDGTKQYIEEKLKNNSSFSSSDLAYLIFYYNDKGMNPEQINNTLMSIGMNRNIKSALTPELISMILKKNLKDSDLQGDFSAVNLYKLELDYLFEQVEDDTVRKLLYLSLIVSKWNNHPSGWVRYDRESLFEFWDLHYSEEEKKRLMILCNQYGLELRVIGSKNPIICFAVNFKVIETSPVYSLTKGEDIKKIYNECLKLYGLQDNSMIRKGDKRNE